MAKAEEEVTGMAASTKGNRGITTNPEVKGLKAESPVALSLAEEAVAVVAIRRVPAHRVTRW